MAATSAIMELRRVPHGANAHAHRGAENLVRLTGSRLTRTLASTGVLVPDPDDNATLCVPHHVLEGLFSRALGASALSDALCFGISGRNYKGSRGARDSFTSLHSVAARYGLCPLVPTIPR